MQDEGTAGVEAMQAFRTRVRGIPHVQRGALANVLYSGDKKTKGAALVF
jgi:hypothetical protein